MTRSARRAAFLGLSLTFLAAAGCSSDGGVFGMFGREDITKQLSLAVRQATDSYLANLSKLTDTVKGISDFRSAVAARDQVADGVTKVRDDVNTLTNVSGPERGILALAFGAQIDAQNQAFLKQATRFSNDTLLNNAVGYLVSEVKLFEAPKINPDLPKPVKK